MTIINNRLLKVLTFRRGDGHNMAVVSLHHARKKCHQRLGRQDEGQSLMMSFIYLFIVSDTNC